MTYNQGGTRCMHAHTQVHVGRGGWAAAVAEDIDERRPPDVQLGRCQGHTPMVRITELLRIVSYTISDAKWL